MFLEIWFDDIDDTGLDGVVQMGKLLLRQEEWPKAFIVDSAEDVESEARETPKPHTTHTQLQDPLWIRVCSWLLNEAPCDYFVATCDFPSPREQTCCSCFRLRRTKLARSLHHMWSKYLPEESEKAHKTSEATDSGSPCRRVSNVRPAVPRACAACRRMGSVWQIAEGRCMNDGHR